MRDPIRQAIGLRLVCFTEVSGEEEAGGVCRGRGYLWIFNRSLLITHTVRALCCKADIAISPGPYILSMAQCSGRGARGFVLTGNPEVRSQLTTSCQNQEASLPFL